MPHDSILRQAGAWGAALLPALDVTIRATRRGDAAELFAVERHAFPMFRGPESPGERELFLADNGLRTPVGYLLKVAAERDAALVGYAFFEVRTWGELYVVELAASPPPPARKSPGLGLALYGVAGKVAALLGLSAVTANVCRLDRRDPAVRAAGYCSDTLVALAGKAGLRERGTRGVRFRGGPPEPGDAWLSASPDEVLRNFPNDPATYPTGE